jgi:hypothetical protein
LVKGPAKSAATLYRFTSSLRRGSVASFFACLYLLLSLLATTHSHETALDRRGPATTGAVTVAAPPSHSDVTVGHTLSAVDCPVCDFLANLVSVEPTAPILTYAIVSATVPEMPVRALPYLPFRFCNRSSSRAPPAV